MDCPLCACQFIQAYQHVDHHLLICAHCYRLFKTANLHRSYSYFSLLASSISKVHKTANNKLKQYRKQQDGSLEEIISKGLVQSCFQPCAQIIEKSQRGSLATEDTEALNELLGKSQKNKSEFVKEKYQQTVIALAGRIQPTKQKLKEHGQALLEKTQAIRDKYRNFRGQFRTIKAELPPIGDIANQAKQKLSTFFKFF